ncbi:uncharacterized protein LOC110986056 isoform X1 [Acanthaster planci]|uniref:Uncharacterized protein LOC110986056 isoform X1 n=1 Tax=Acanthaster planci TaxID=133434 RepID=A0A8B7ZEC3_ACAPL|nr:uncharacterized protein LOC110986056 isoform X1 [Acanthaster planci]XP_022103345.1 uncharacterized protein LOC110986056 isoform X1 [Acanthaster planci]XP_022103346.1 uncharacterized protein LOC110986056 isoform X1 [Acanthaster planci]XP_022103347.1 uncharacterized protein LOC110986056 isoform X1 [Acanthaster planci]XP_022103348.1 uncharacterized protein LOC110986056 isoform X1 [Acanthaster planci]
MVILRCFRLICITGVVASIISFVLGTLAISTGSWLLSQGEVPTMQFPDDTVPDDLGSSVAPGNLSDWSRNNTENTTTTGTVTTARTTELTATTGQTATDAWMRSTGTMSPSDAGENVTTAELQIITVIATSGLWHVCQAKIQDGVVVGEWLCSNIIGSLALMQSSKHLKILKARSADLESSVTVGPQSDLTVYIETSEVYFQSMLAFELISVAATLAGSCIATVAIYKQQPLAVLVAAFTMFFAGLFMLVGHVMMLSIHKANNDGTNENSWYYGWSFIVAWLSFCMCLVSGTINCVVYRNFRKMSEELTGTPSRVKYANRPPPVNLGSSI